MNTYITLTSYVFLVVGILLLAAFGLGLMLMSKQVGIHGSLLQVKQQWKTHTVIFLVAIFHIGIGLYGQYLVRLAA